MTRIRASGLLLAVLAAFLPGCTEPTPTVDRFPALGTLVEVTLYDVDSSRSAPALRALRAEFAEIDRDWPAWRDADDLADAEAMAGASGRLFEPRIGALVELWGFHDGERAPGPPPDAAGIQDWLDGRLPVQIDLGAYAKGAALERGAAVLREAGVANVLINAGGDIIALGDAGGRPWRVGIRHPRATGVLGGIALDDGEAVLTSGDYERGFEWDGVRYHHILDPRTGWPAMATASITVVARNAAHADAAATALFVAGDDWPEVAIAMGMDTVLRVAADGHIELSASMAARIDFVADATGARIIDLDVAAR